MSDDIKNIELETVRLRMERERLALNAEMRKRDMAVAVSNAAPRVWSKFISLVKYGIFFLVGLVVIYRTVMGYW